MKITLRQLRVFDAVATMGSVSHAAKEISLSQSAASMSLADLEQHLGAPLFHRYGKKLQLNDYGRWLRPKAHQLLQQAEEIEHSANSDSLNGQLIIGASSTIGNYLLAGLIADFVKLHPGVDIRLQVGNSEKVIDDMLNLRIDLGLIEGPCHNQHLMAQPWRNDELTIFCSPDHRLADHKKVSLRALQKQRWILREQGSGTREVFTLAAKDKLDQLDVILELSHSEAIKQAVKTGLGIGCLSQRVIANEVEYKQLVSLDVPGLTINRQLSILSRVGQQHSELSLCLQRFIRG